MSPSNETKEPHKWAPQMRQKNPTNETKEPHKRDKRALRLLIQQALGGGEIGRRDRQLECISPHRDRLLEWEIGCVCTFQLKCTGRRDRQLECISPHRDRVLEWEIGCACTFQLKCTGRRDRQLECMWPLTDGQLEWEIGSLNERWTTEMTDMGWLRLVGSWKL